VVTKAVRKVPPVLVLTLLAGLQVARIDTGWTAIDEFAGRFVYFYAGYVLAPHVFTLAAAAQARPGVSALCLAVWAAINGALVELGLAGAPFISLLLGFAGAGAVIGIAALLAMARIAEPIRFCGAHSIVIYLAFFLPMAATRTLLVATGLVPDIGVMSLLVTGAGVLGALGLWVAAGRFHLRFLFERPQMLRLASGSPAPMLPAE
jgi:uncharacterized membrane protein YcfT